MLDSLEEALPRILVDKRHRASLGFRSATLSQVMRAVVVDLLVMFARAYRYII